MIFLAGGDSKSDNLSSRGDQLRVNMARKFAGGKMDVKLGSTKNRYKVFL